MTRGSDQVFKTTAQKEHRTHRLRHLNILIVSVKMFSRFSFFFFRDCECEVISHRQLQHGTQTLNAFAVILEILCDYQVGAPVRHEFGLQTESDSSDCPRRLGRDELFVGDHSVHQLSINYQMDRPRHPHPRYPNRRTLDQGQGYAMTR